jgi:hypothetical protein
MWITKNPAYANAALRQSQRTVSGLMSTFKDNVSQTMGMAEKGWFHFFQRTAVGMNNWFTKLQSNQKKTKDLFKALDMTLTPRSHAFIKIWRLLADTFRMDAIMLKEVFLAVARSKTIWASFYLTLRLVNVITTVLFKTMRYWIPLLKLIIIYLIVTRIWLIVTTRYWKIYWGIQRLYIVWLFRRAAVMRVLMRLEKAAAAVTALWTVATKGYIRAANGQFVALTGLQKIVLRLRLAVLSLWTAWLESGPIGWLIGAILLLTVGLVILYFKWKKFHDAVNATAKFLWQHPYFLGLLAVIAPVIVAVVLLVKYFRTLVHWIKTAAHWIGRIHWPHIGVPGWIRRHVPGFQAGGVMPYTGAAMVGERGPELVHLPRGASVTPNRGVGKGLAGLIEVIVIPAPVKIDGRTVAEIVAKHTTTVNARA